MNDKNKNFFDILFGLIAAIYPVLFFLFLIILNIPIRIFSLFIIALALIEFLIKFLYRKNEKKDLSHFISSIILFAIGLVCYIINTNIAFKFYPVLINIVLLYTFGITLFQPPVIIYRFAVLIDKSIPNSPGEKIIAAYCRKVTILWVMFFIINGSIAALTAFFAAEFIWFIYNGPVCGVLTGTIFTCEYIVRITVLRKIPGMKYYTVFQTIKMNMFKSGMFFYLRISMPFRLRPRKKLRFETDLAGHCNLNCKYCTHFSPLVENEFVNTASLEKDFARLSQLCGRDNENIDLMGGEPLLHPDIIQIIEAARKYFDGPVNIVTNGLLLPKMSEAFWLSCKKNNIRLSVTSYPINLNLKQIKQTAKKYAVKLKMNVHTWCRLPKDIKGEQDIKDSFSYCAVANKCIFLKDGKLSTCCLPLIAFRFNNYFSQKFQVSEKDYIDIYSVNDKREIFNFLSKPMPFCRYCKIKNGDVGIDWEVTKKDIHEWID